MDVKAQMFSVVGQLEGQALNSLVAGFSFASAIAWMDVVRMLVAMAVKSNRQGAIPLTMTALTTTLLSILVFMLVSRFSTRVKEPTAPVFAVTR
jgi:F0F1-type ATP synthase assembly protein I